ncbi:uncharacterized protein [Montipora foliosa]|uniref:uncharacterized protein isoform X1 n=1 Tax=Montipora foliosa TaxID=591990 RepID=UPI0035F1FB75
MQADQHFETIPKFRRHSTVVGMTMAKVLLVFFFVGTCLSELTASSCSQKTFKDAAKSCINNFYEDLRKNPHKDCRHLFSKTLSPCIQNIVEKCKNETDAENLELLKARSDDFIAQGSYYCTDGMLNSFKNFKSRDCPVRALEKARKCAQSFHKTFREDKGSPSLCRKFKKAKRCITRALERCKKSRTVDKTMGLYRESYNPHCLGGQDAYRKPVRDAIKPFGACTAREYSLKTRECISSFVQTLQKEPRTSCRRTFFNKYYLCSKNIAFECFKNVSSYDMRNIKRWFTSSRSHDEQMFCDGINLKLSYPRRLRYNHCEKNYVQAKETCESSYIATYKENKADKSLCRKYAEAKSCTKNATLRMCTVTSELLEEVNFIYDNFNPFCLQFTDPPFTAELEEKEERIPPESEGEKPEKPIERDTRSSAIPRVNKGQFVIAKPWLCLAFAIFFLIVEVFS